MVTKCMTLHVGRLQQGLGKNISRCRVYNMLSLFFPPEHEVDILSSVILNTKGKILE